MKSIFGAQIVYLLTIDYSFGINLMESLYFSMTTDIYLDNYEYYFTTVEILTIKDCAKLCHSVTSCKVGDYWRPGNYCRLKHVLGETQFRTNSRKNPDFISWTRDMTDKIFTDDNSPCQNRSSDKSYMVNYDNGTCSSYACGKLRVGSSFSTLGNVLTTNGKALVWSCYSHEDDTILPPRSVTCTDDARWEGLNTTVTGLNYNCTYSKHTMSDGSVFTYKVVDIRADQRTALRSCRKDSANLTTIFTLEKLDFYRGILESSNESYWVDAERINATEWRTSYGEIQPLGYDIWEIYNQNMNHNCSRMQKRAQYKLNDMNCSVETYSYICERQLQ